MTCQVSYTDEDESIASTTLATAQASGWIWDIGLPTRRGVGYAYSSRYASKEQAEQTLYEYLYTKSAEKPVDISLRHLSFEPGYREKFWHKNCLAIGLSAGFIEPLEASALAMVELSVSMLVDEFPQDKVHMQHVAKRFNQRFEYRWQRVIEFLKLHYVLSHRQDSPYWLDNRKLETIPDNLQASLELWRYQSPSRHDFIQNEEVFSSASYQYVLYGMGFDTQLKVHNSYLDDLSLAERFFGENQKRVAQYTQGLPSNRALLNHIKNTE